MIEITDSYVLKILRWVNSPTVNFNISYMEESDREGRLDIEILVDELEYAVDMYTSTGTLQNQELRLSKKIQERTKCFSTIPVDPTTLEPIYSKAQISSAELVLNEFCRLTDALDKSKEG